MSAVAERYLPDLATDRFVDVHEVAELTSIPASTLRSWRSRGVGPRSSKLGRRIVYRWSEVQAWVGQQETATSRGGAA